MKRVCGTPARLCDSEYSCEFYRSLAARAPTGGLVTSTTGRSSASSMFRSR